MSRKIVLYIAVAVFLATSFSSCKFLNPSIMLRTDKNYKFDTPPDSQNFEYKIAPNDYVTFQLYARNGFKLIDITSGGAGAGQAQTAMQNTANMIRYRVEPDGFVRLPIIGRVFISGKTIREAESNLQELYTEYYNDPYIIINIINRRVVVFTGNDGQGTVINLVNDNTTLIEALAMAGGIQQTGKSYKVKLVRRDEVKPKVYFVDLSTIEGLKYANMLVQANDIIYVEPRLGVLSDILREITPIVSLITSALLVFTVVRTF